MLFAGRLNRNALHSHSAPVLIAGIYDDFDLKIAHGPWQKCEAAVVRAGVPYEFDAGGRPLAVIYIEPNVAAAEGLIALIKETREVPGAILGMRSDLSLIRALYEDRESPRWVDEGLADLTRFSAAKARRETDQRIARAVESVSFADDEEREIYGRPSVSSAARAAGLSLSRFQHLFKAEVGVSYRRYLGWARMRMALREAVAGSNFTTAAHAAGFYDQAHFAHEFRRIFGAPASLSLANVRRVSPVRV